MAPATEPLLALPPPLCGTDRVGGVASRQGGLDVGGVDSFARETVLVRLPKILETTLAENAGAFDAEVLSKLALIAAGLAAADEDGHVVAIGADGGEDMTCWNEHLCSLGCNIPGMCSSWAGIPWWTCENYLYRRMLEATGYFAPAGSCPGAGVDFFQSQKSRATDAAAGAFALLAAAHEAELAGAGRAAAGGGAAPVWAAHIGLLLRWSLWANHFDLSLTGGSVDAEGEAAAKCAALLEQGEARLLASESDAALATLAAAGADSTVTFVLDNCGLELLADLVLADGLLARGAAGRVILQCKAQPVFVSDAMAKDITQAVDWIAARGVESCVALAARLTAAQAEGRLVVSPQRFYTTASPWWEMHPPSQAVQRHGPAPNPYGPGVLTEFGGSALAIVKGDANYRRLLGDLKWERHVPFNSVVSYFPCGIMALRTCKSEVLVGVPKERQDEAAAEDPKWLVNGRYGVMQYAHPR